MDFQLKDKVALVTGGSRGIGREICTTLAARGAWVAVNHSSSSEAAFRSAWANTATTSIELTSDVSLGCSAVRSSTAARASARIRACSEDGVAGYVCSGSPVEALVSTTSIGVTRSTTRPGR